MQILSLYAVFLEKSWRRGGRRVRRGVRRQRSEVRRDYGSVPLLILSGPEGKSL